MTARGCVFLVLLGTSAALAEERADEEIRPFDQVVFLSATGSREQITCRVLNEIGDQIEVEKVNEAGAAVGKFSLMRSHVQEIIRRQTPEQVYKVKLGRLPRPAEPAPERARGNLELGIWCRKPHPRLRGEPPMPAKAFGHLLKAVEIDPKLDAAYPYLLDALASRRSAGGAADETAEIAVDQELEVYLLAEAGGYRDPEIDFRLGEVYLERGLTDEARERFEAVLGWKGRPNQSLAGRSRRYLMRVYLERGEFDRALQLYQADLAAADADPAAFEPLYQSARILVARGQPEDRSRARSHLERARQLQPDFPGLGLQSAAIDYLEGKHREAENTLRRTLPLAPGDPEHLSALGLVLAAGGKFSAAEGQFRLALAAVPEGAPSPAVSQAHLGLGLIRDYRGDAAGALEEYSLGRQAAPANLAALLLYSRLLLGAGDLSGARAALEDGMRSRLGEPSGLAACLRALADVEIAARAEDRALRYLLHALEIDAADPFLERKVGVLLLRSGMLEAAKQHLDLARKLGGDQPETLNALGHYHYNRGDMAEAEKAFAQVLKILPRQRAAEEAAAPPPVPAARLYAERALAQVIDARTLEVWEDAFEREDGEEVHRGWLKQESYGIRIALRGGHLEFSGAQQNQADGITKLSREAPSMEIERVSARFRFDEASAGTRAGIRLESSQREAGAGLVFLRDFDGALRYSAMTTRSSWEDGQPTAEKNPSSGKTVYAGDRKWPNDTGFHTLMIRRSDPAAGGKGFDLLLDGEPIAWNVQVSGLTTTAGKMFAVGISCQVRSLGVPASFQADNFKIYRKKPEAQRNAPR